MTLLLFTYALFMKISHLVMQSVQGQQQSSTPRVRTRHGCWTCRRRRRKCDEDKPNCQNCIQKGLGCKYGIQLTFHDVNLLELNANEARELEENAPTKYPSLQFVDGMEDIQDDCDQNHSNQDDESVARCGESSLRNRRSNDAVRNCSEVETVLDLSAGGSPNTILYLNTVPPESNFHENIDTPQVSGNSRDLDANHALHSATLIPPPASGYTIASSQLVEIETTRFSSDCQVRDDLSLREHQNLLKYYIDNVAPWLELCSSEAFYSTHIPVLSSKYSPLRQAIFALSATQCHENTDNALGDTLLTNLFSSLRTSIHSCQEELLFTRQLILVTRLFSFPMRQWRQILADEVANYDELGMNGFIDGARGTASWLMLRFDIAVSINSRLRLNTNLRCWQQTTSSPRHTNRSLETDHLYDALLLCAKVVDFCQSMESKNDPDAWSQYLCELRDLGNNSTSEMIPPLLRSHIGKTTFSKPPIASSSPPLPASFPISVYTNRPSFYIQLLNHLTYMLLIQCKPRRIQSGLSIGMNTSASHAVQLCGLALGNPILWSRDPVVVVALIFAGPSLSYLEQQVELLQYLKMLRKITRWDFEQEIEDLKDIWKAGC